MIAVDIPGFRKLSLEHLVLDYNGTLARDGVLLPRVAESITSLAGALQIHVITADTYGLASVRLAGLPVKLVIIPGAAQAERKLEFVASLDPQHVAAIGNGRNDRLMLETAALGIALIQAEGGAVETLIAADVTATDIIDAFGLLQHPMRLVATLRS